MVFKGQSLSLSLDTDDVITGYTGKILYKKPNGVTGSWNGNITGDLVTYNITSTDVDVAGVWELQAYAENGATKKYGQRIVIEFRTSL